jgi:hypothetical protein
MAEPDGIEESCETCKYLREDDECGNAESVYFRRPMVYRDGDEVVQTGWCDLWEQARIEQPEEREWMSM